MKKYFFYTLFLFCVTIFAQEKEQHVYKFDYCTISELVGNNNTTTIKYILANTQNKDYFIHIDCYKNDIKAVLYDTATNSQFVFNKIENQDINSISFNTVFNKPVKFNYTFNKNEYEDKYITTVEDLDSLKKVNIKIYKNPRKKKLVSERNLCIKPHEKIKNNIFVTNLIFAHKYNLNQIKAEGILVLDEVINNNKTETYYKLKEYIDVNFNLTINHDSNLIYSEISSFGDILSPKNKK